MEETIEKRKEKLKHKIAKIPVFKPKPKDRERKEIPVMVKPEKSEVQQKVKAGFVPPATVGDAVESGKTKLPLFGRKPATEISASEEKMKSAATEIKVKREVKEHLKGSVEEIVSEPQKLKKLLSEIKEPEEIMFKPTFDSFVPLIGREIENHLEAPKIELKIFTPSAIKTDFYASLPKIEFKERVVTIPELSVTKPSEVIVRDYIDKEISQQVISKMKVFKEVEMEEEKIDTAVGALEKKEETLAASVGEAEKELELPNFFELLLGKGARKISEGGPICIIIEETKEKYEELIAILCRDIFREKIGGKPTPIYRETIEELRHEFESLVERKLIVVKKVEKSSEYLIQILKGFFSQDMGFLILVSHEPIKLEDEIGKSGELSANIIVVSPPPEIEWEGIIDDFLKIIRGTESFIRAESFGEEFKKAVDTFDDELIEKYLNYKKAPSELKENWDRLTKCSPEDYAQASEIHSAMKAFVWMYEWKNSGKRKNPELETENRGVDVRIEDRNYEVETFFGVGDIMSKLTGKIKKYEKGDEVYFVLRNLDILRNFPLFSSFRRNWRKAGYEVEFFGLDLDREKLLPLEEFVKLAKSMMGSLVQRGL